MSALTQIQRADIPALGTPIGGGFAVKTYRDGDKEYLLIVAGKEGDIEGKWLDAYTDLPNTRSCVDGLANTLAMSEANSPLAKTALALRIGDVDDWHIPARDQLELLYRHLKPTTDENDCSFRDGDNPSALPPTYPYTAEEPQQTAIAAFQAGGEHAIAPEWYWSSTQSSAYVAYMQHFGDGLTGHYYKGYSYRARVVRRLLVI